jgi:hypothetical protein
MLDLSSQWEAMGRAGREHISEHFNADINVPQLEELYREISGSSFSIGNRFQPHIDRVGFILVRLCGCARLILGESKIPSSTWIAMI